ncbi:hypothetical protein ABT340_04840 [Streptosporangium sp. NPDC000239]|uniref:hypothetical protein n=1 Tax=Streptosporangium sp. NPDC000239 TaxID=3154248 RepID=UPI003320DEFD
MTPVEEIRAAAARLRSTDHHGTINGDTDNEELIRLIGDLLRSRESLAKWLEAAAKEYLTTDWTDCPAAAAALPVARAILGATR